MSFTALVSILFFKFFIDLSFITLSFHHSTTAEPRHFDTHGDYMVWFLHKYESSNSKLIKSIWRYNMPRGDKTGPLGEGPMTGRKGGQGRGMGMRRGKGFGRRAAVPSYDNDVTHSRQNEAETLRQEAQQLEAALKEIKNRLAKLEE
jgi:hypothetical protein